MSRTTALSVSRTTLALLAALTLALLALTGSGLTGVSDQAGSSWTKTSDSSVTVAGSRWSSDPNASSWA